MISKVGVPFLIYELRTMLTGGETEHAGFMLNRPVLDELRQAAGAPVVMAHWAIRSADDQIFLLLDPREAWLSGEPGMGDHRPHQPAALRASQDLAEIEHRLALEKLSPRDRAILGVK